MAGIATIGTVPSSKKIWETADFVLDSLMEKLEAQKVFPDEMENREIMVGLYRQVFLHAVRTGDPSIVIPFLPEEVFQSDKDIIRKVGETIREVVLELKPLELPGPYLSHLLAYAEMCHKAAA